MGNNKYTQETIKIFNKLKQGEGRRKLDPSLVLKHKLTIGQQNFLEEWMNNGHDQLEAYRVTNPSKLEGRSPITIRTRASQLINSTKIQNYLRDFQYRAAFNPETEEPIITVNDVVTELAKIIRSDVSKDSDRIKASEVVLKHLNAFSDHNSSRAPKILNYIQNQSTDELIDDIHAMQQDLIREGKMLVQGVTAGTNNDDTNNNDDELYADFEDIDDDDTDLQQTTT
jgi:hypothetical protein